jgi:hypothetical protein
MYSKEQIEMFLKKDLQKKEFHSPEGKDFEALTLAQRWANENGYTVAPLCGDEPTGIAKGASYISKWRNLGDDKVKLDGVIVCDELGARNAKVMTAYFKV